MAPSRRPFSYVAVLRSRLFKVEAPDPASRDVNTQSITGIRLFNINFSPKPYKHSFKALF